MLKRDREERRNYIADAGKVRALEERILQLETELSHDKKRKREQEETRDRHKSEGRSLEWDDKKEEWKRPPGRPPANMEWDGKAGKYVYIE